MKDSVFGNGLWSILVNVCHQEICLPASKGETFKFQMLKNVLKKYDIMYLLLLNSVS